MSIGESDITQENAKNKNLYKWVVNKAPENIRAETSFNLNGSIEFYAESGAFIHKESCSFYVTFDVVERNPNLASQHDLHMQALEVIKEVKTATVTAIKDISAASAQALNAVATPLSEVSKALVKMAEDSRASAAKSAEDAQQMLIQALTNRIVEGNQTRGKGTGFVEDIKEVLTLLPMLQAALGEPAKLAAKAQPELPGLTSSDGPSKLST